MLGTELMDIKYAVDVTCVPPEPGKLSRELEAILSKHKLRFDGNVIFWENNAVERALVVFASIKDVKLALHAQLAEDKTRSFDFVVSSASGIMTSGVYQTLTRYRKILFKARCPKVPKPTNIANQPRRPDNPQLSMSSYLVPKTLLLAKPHPPGPTPVIPPIQPTLPQSSLTTSKDQSLLEITDLQAQIAEYRVKETKSREDMERLEGLHTAAILSLGDVKKDLADMEVTSGELKSQIKELVVGLEYERDARRLLESKMETNRRGGFSLLDRWGSDDDHFERSSDTFIDDDDFASRRAFLLRPCCDADSGITMADGVQSQMPAIDKEEYPEPNQSILDQPFPLMLPSTSPSPPPVLYSIYLTPLTPTPTSRQTNDRAAKRRKLDASGFESNPSFSSPHPSLLYFSTNDDNGYPAPPLRPRRMTKAPARFDPAMFDSRGNRKSVNASVKEELLHDVAIHVVGDPVHAAAVDLMMRAPELLRAYVMLGDMVAGK